MSLKKKIICVIIAFAAVFIGKAVYAKGGDAKQNVLVPATCNNNVASVYTGYNKSGDKVSFTAGARQDVSGQTWRVTVVDNGLVLVNQTFPFASSDWSILANYTSPKGERSVNVTISTSDSITVCTQTLSYKA